jgi:hypothetical protein
VEILLEAIWESFFQCLKSNNAIHSVEQKKVSGSYFIYIKEDNEPIPINQYESILKDCANQLILLYKVTYQIKFVRKENNTIIFRHRFLVPQSKMFCCGNQCIDCIRFNKDYKVDKKS